MAKNKRKQSRRARSRPEIGFAYAARQRSRRADEADAKALSYLDRTQLLIVLGFGSYKRYRDSETWKRIRSAVFGRHGNKCKLCRGNADVVHHLDYSKVTLLGISLDALVPLCEACHTAVEMDGDQKRTLQQAQKEYARLLASAPAR